MTVAAEFLAAVEKEVAVRVWWWYVAARAKRRFVENILTADKMFSQKVLSFLINRLFPQTSENRLDQDKKGRY